VKPGARVSQGELLAEVQAHDAERAAPILERVRRAVKIGQEPVTRAPLAHGRVEAGPLGPVA